MPACQITTAPRLVVVLALVVGCTREAPAESEPLVVFAASSTADAFRELASAFEEEHPDTPVELAFAGSQTLRLQLEHGAPADIIATANEAHIRSLADAGVVRGAVPFAENRLVVIVPKENPSGLAAFEDLPNANRVVVGLPSVPLGAYTEQLFERGAGVWGATSSARLRRHVVSKEANARLVRAKVELGEADAAVVYATDARGRPEVDVIPVPEALNVTALYFMARVDRPESHPQAGAWIDFLRTERARGILGRHGFQTHGD